MDSLTNIEERILQYWKEIDAFKTSLERSKKFPPFVFYEGPPFATGLPHYGHILTAIIKDIVCRYQTMNGRYVERRAGWDCHGLPIEYEIEKLLGIKTKEQVLKYGIDNYNKKCREIVMGCAEQWDDIISRVGRWLDFKNDYKTMDTDFMESVWWVFSELFKKGLVYQGFKVMPYSTGCTTPLSNFEAKSNYKKVREESIIVSFPLIDQEAKLLAWTTTPWTLPSNLALCINPVLEYIKIKDNSNDQVYILAKDCLKVLYKKPKKSCTILETFLGEGLIGQKYQPLFDYFKESSEFQVVGDNFVKNDSGTGIVHLAPAFGEDDFRVCLDNGLISQKGENLVCPVDDNGRFTHQVPEFEGRYIKDCDKDIISEIKKKGLLIKRMNIEHEYPFCWRSGTPLIYKAVTCWFINVVKITDQLLENNLKTNWVPEYIKTNKFHNWLENARDWCVSRNRYWGTPLPIWMSEDGEEIVCISSIQELYELSGILVDDLHREHIDHITIPSKKGRGRLHRVPEVLDCWFESGSMPFAQSHYPFSGKPISQADFISEGGDQCRGWFYTLMVISTALFNQPPFKNVIVNGLVLAEDGNKMSKSLRNYPDPLLVVRNNCADALRLALINTPVVRGESLKFNEKSVSDKVKRVILPWMNGYNFYKEQYEKFIKAGLEMVNCESGNVMDKWILNKIDYLIEFVKTEMMEYRLYTVVPKLVDFVNDITNWYIKINRDRIKGKFGDNTDWNCALMTLYQVLYKFTVIMAPFTPFISEHLYQSLKSNQDVAEESVHYCLLSDLQTDNYDSVILRKVGGMQRVINLLRYVRDIQKIALQRPLKKVIIAHNQLEYREDILELVNYISSVINILEIEVEEQGSYIEYTVVPNMKQLGKTFKKDAKGLADKIRKLDKDQIRSFLEKGFIVIGDICLDEEFIQVCPITREIDGYESYLEEKSKEPVLVLVDISIDKKITQLFDCRRFVRLVQELRKEGGLHPWDKIVVCYQSSNLELLETFADHTDKIVTAIGASLSENIDGEDDKLVITKELDVNGKMVKVSIYYQ